MVNMGKTWVVGLGAMILWIQSQKVEGGALQNHTQGSDQTLRSLQNPHPNPILVVHLSCYYHLSGSANPKPGSDFHRLTVSDPGMLAREFQI